MRRGPQCYKNKIIHGVRAALGIRAKAEPADFDFDASIIKDNPIYQQLEEDLGREYEEHIEAMPQLEKKRTIYIFSTDDGPPVNMLTAHFYRRQIAKQYKHLHRLGIDNFICDTMTPLGLIALAELSRLRKKGENISIYGLRYSRSPKNYRMQRKYRLNILYLICKCDYNYGRIYNFCELKCKILNHCCFVITNIKHGLPYALPPVSPQNLQLGEAPPE